MIRVRDVKISIENNNDSFIKNKLKKVLKTDILSYQIVKKSIDARKELLFVYTFDVEIKNEKEVLKRNEKNIFKTPDEKYLFEIKGTENLNTRPIIVGAGPAGLFLGYILAENNYKPIIIERGEKIEDRINTVEKFWKDNVLNENSNVQFGEGGAGTFSDGKLNTLVRDKFNRNKKVFDIFVECGAPKEIMYENKPHIGTDVLRKVVVNIRNKIIEFGGEFRYNSLMTDIIINNNRVEKIKINEKEELTCDNLFLALGHSARETFYLLNEKGIEMKSKPFAIGVRIMHKQEDINKSLYGKYYKDMPPASYKLTYNTKEGRGVYSFCMCPGGYVVNASSEKNRLVINGMSNYKRDSEVANSALVVSVTSKDFGDNIFSGLEFQRKLEFKAYTLGNGYIPIQRYKDFVNDVDTISINKFKPAIKGGYSLSNLNKLLPNYVIDSIKEAMPSFKKQLSCFDDDDSLLLGIETRTSSPITIIRNEEGMSNIKGIYPVGEGAGYSGGIITSAMDGLKQAENFAKKYHPFD